jgi:hypothetical protein
MLVLVRLQALFESGMLGEATDVRPTRRCAVLANGSL